jgi:hypothetical protein
MRSTVLAGAIGHEEVFADYHSGGDMEEYTVQHARKGPAPLTPTGNRVLTRRISGVITSEHTYNFPEREFHRSFVPELAVTLVVKLGQMPSPARVLFPYGYKPEFGVSAFDSDEAMKYVAMAQTALRSGS